MDRCRTWLAWVLIGVFAVLAPAVQADTQEERIARLEAQLAAMQRELALLKSQPSQPAAPASEQAITAGVDKAVTEKMAQQPKVPDWVSNVKLSGDFRYRHEWTDDASRVADRNRHRIQARIALYGTANERSEEHTSELQSRT